MTVSSDGPLTPSTSTAEGGAESREPAAVASAAASAASVSAKELEALQAAEEAKGDPALDEVPSAEIDVPDEKEEPFEKLAAAARRLSEARVRTVVETLLFLAERPLALEEIRQATGSRSRGSRRRSTRSPAITATGSPGSSCTRSPAAGSSAPRPTTPISRAASSG